MENDTIRTEEFLLESEGLQLRIFMAIPKSSEKPLPLVQVHHGGGGYDMVYEEMAIEMARNNIVGVTMVHRGYPGSDGEMEYGKGEIQDIKNLTKELIKKPYVDKKRIGIMGYSRGGHNAILAIEQSDYFAAGALWSTPVDMIDLVRSVPWVSEVIGGTPDDIPDEYYMRSSINFVSQINCPLLILHGEQDDVVSVEHALRLSQAMETYDKPFDIKVFPGEGHIWTLSSFENNRRITLDFFQRHLNP